MIIWPNHDLALTYGQHRPTQRLRPEPGQAPQIVSVHDDMVQRHRHLLSMHGDQPVSFPCVGHSDRLADETAAGITHQNCCNTTDE